MDILEFLEKYHERLRKELVTVNNSLYQGRGREQIKTYIALHELHESIEEDILLPKLNSCLKDRCQLKLLQNNEQEHKEVWNQLEKMMNSLGTGRFPSIQNTFFNLYAVLDAHMEHEEQVLFPMIRELVNQETLQEMGQRAERKYTHYALA